MSATPDTTADDLPPLPDFAPVWKHIMTVDGTAQVAVYNAMCDMLRSYAIAARASLAAPAAQPVNARVLEALRQCRDVIRDVAIDLAVEQQHQLAASLGERLPQRHKRAADDIAALQDALSAADAALSTPVQAVPLTDIQIANCATRIKPYPFDLVTVESDTLLAFVRAIERAHGITGDKQHGKA